MTSFSSSSSSWDLEYITSTCPAVLFPAVCQKKCSARWKSNNSSYQSGEQIEMRCFWPILKCKYALKFTAQQHFFLLHSVLYSTDAPLPCILFVKSLTRLKCNTRKPKIQPLLDPRIWKRSHRGRPVIQFKTQGNAHCIPHMETSGCLPFILLHFIRSSCCKLDFFFFAQRTSTLGMLKACPLRTSDLTGGSIGSWPHVVAGVQHNYFYFFSRSWCVNTSRRCETEEWAH